MAQNLAQDLGLRARTSPDATGLIYEDGRRFTYGELDAQAARVAQALTARGLVPGQRVALYLQNSPELVWLLFGCWKAGIVPVAVSVLYQGEELRRAVVRTDATLLVADERNPAAVAALAATGLPTLAAGAPLPGVPTLAAALAAAPEVFAGGDLPDGHEGMVLFTGGTSGDPKAVAITHAGAYRSMALLARASKGGRNGPFPTASPEVSPNLIALPLFHGGGLQSLLFALHVGRSVVLMERFRVDRLVTLVAEHRIDNLFLLPTMVHDLAHARGDLALASVRQVLVAGQTLDPDVRRTFEERFRVLIHSNYGSAETGHVAGWTAADVKAGRWKPGSAGRVYDGVEVEIRDEAHQALPPGVAGEVCVRTDRTKGYVGDEGTATEGLIRDGWVYSGDIGYLDAERVLFLVGRKRDLIKTGGFQVWPSEVEGVVRAHPAVADAAVVGVPDARLGEVPVAFVVPEVWPPADPDALALELVTWTRDRLAHFKAARRVEFLAALPRSEVGKIQRGALVERAASAAPSGAGEKPR